MNRRLAAMTLAATSTALLVAACSSSTSSTSSPSASATSAAPSTSSATATSATASPTTSESNIGGDVLPPVIVTPGEQSTTAKVGNTIVFNVADPTTTKISTDKPAILELTQGGTDGSATFNPGAKALSAGEAVVTITEAGGATREVVVTVTS